MSTKQERPQKRRPFLQTTAALLLAAVMLLTGCTAQNASDSAAGSGSTSSAETAILSTEQPQRTEETPMGESGTWTIFIYMCGADLESNGGMASLNLMQIMKAVPSDKVNVIVQTGGASSWGLTDDEDNAAVLDALDIADIDPSLINVSADALQRYRVTDHMELLEELPLASMGAEDTFYDFLKWGVENYPAEHMGIIMWDHGGSGTSGVCVDELYDYDSLLPFEMNEALQRLFPQMTDRFEFIGFDACLMSTVEVANALSPFARYLYASEETIPGFGWAYIENIKALNADPTQDGKAFGKAVCDNYYDLYTRIDELVGSAVDSCTLSVTDLEKMNGVVDALDALGDKLVAALDKPEELKKVTRAALHTENFAYPYMLDMGSLAEDLESIYPEEAKALQDALSEAVVYSTHGSFSADSTGMAIFYPRSSLFLTAGDYALSQLIVRYALCAPSQSYYDFVKEIQFTQYRTMMSGVPTVHVVEEPHLESVDEENIAYTMTLDPSDLDKVAEMNYQIWLLDEVELSNGSTMTTGILLGSRLGVQYDETTGKVTDDFDDSWKWVMMNGVPLQMNIQSYDEDEVIYHSPILLNDNRTNLVIRWRKATDSYELVGTYTGFDDETNTLSRRIYPLNDGDVIIPRYEVTRAEFIQSGIMEYPEMGMGMTSYDTLPDHVITYDQDNTVLEYTELKDGDYYFQYYLTDLYGSRQGFDPLEFTMKDKEAYVQMPEEEEEASSASGEASAAA